MRKILINAVSIVLTLTMLFGVMSVSIAATEGNDVASVNIKINDIDNNVVNIKTIEV